MRSNRQTSIDVRVKSCLLQSLSQSSDKQLLSGKSINVWRLLRTTAPAINLLAFVTSVPTNKIHNGKIPHAILNVFILPLAVYISENSDQVAVIVAFCLKRRYLIERESTSDNLVGHAHKGCFAVCRTALLLTTEYRTYCFLC